MTDFERVFVDTAPFIYFLDDSGAFSDSAERFFIDINASRKEIVSSVITCEEYLVVPYRKNMLGKIRSFFDFTSMMGIELSPVTLEIAKKRQPRYAADISISSQWTAYSLLPQS